MKEELERKKEKILEYIYSKEYNIITVKQLAVILDVPKEDISKLENIITKLEEDGKIYVDNSKRICIPDNKNKFVCKYEAKSKGFGFARVISKDTNEKDIYISRDNNLGACDLDIILVEVIAQKNDGKNLEGKVINIIKRSEKSIVGIVKKSDTFAFVEVLNDSINDIYIPYKLMQGVDNNDRVVVKITKYPAGERKAEGRITEVIGHESDKDIDSQVIFASFGIVDKFSKEALEQAEEVASITEEDIEGRVDLRDKNIYTIDGDDAKDLDDAISVEKVSDTEYKLSVHIADVSHYVTDGSEIDKEAIKRGTSIYTPAKVIPMLPRTLSNGICSLTEGEDRLTLSIDMVIDDKAHVLFSNIYKSVIRSKKRMSYAKVECVLNNTNQEVLEEYKDFEQDIFVMKELYKILKDARNKSGSINFDIPETKFELDENNEVIDLGPYKIGVSNSIIEEFMLIANKEVAKTFKELGAPFIYRIHEKPDTDRLRELNEVLQNMGTSIKGINKIHPKALATVLDAFEGDLNKSMIISKLLLRSLKLAKYSDVCLGHFGLNFTDYCHFTSPIRRYPDLFIHRVISRYIESSYNLEEKELTKLSAKAYKYAVSSSECEKIATTVEREFDDLYMAKYMKKHLGDEYDGVVSSVTSFGIYVKLPNTVEGVVTMSLLDDDYYIYHEKSMSLVGERTGKKYEIGQKVRIKVTRSDTETKQIDFAICGGNNNEENKNC